MHLKTMLFAYFLIFLSYASHADTYEGTVMLRAVRGQEARLPCGIGKPFMDGPQAYVLWLRNNQKIIYRYPNDNVNKGFRFGKPCDAGLCPEDSSLLINKASTRDAGFYTCRIHFQGSPAVDYQVLLNIVEPPGFPRILDEAREEVKKGFVGPLSLNTNLVLTCEVEDAPEESQTAVYWHRNGKAVPQQFSSRFGCIVRVEIRLVNLSRSELDARYDCMAQNSDVSAPLVTSVVIKMFMPPISVEIRMNSNSNFEAGQPRVVDCVVVGCMPPPEITWHLGSTMIRPSVHKALHDGNYTVSSLTLVPSLRHDHSELVCRAHNALMPERNFQDRVTINVGYPPICGMTREPLIGAVKGEVEEVWCEVESSVEPLQFIWTFADSKTMYTSSSKVEGSQHRYQSRLNWMARGGEFGTLTCRATNKFGQMKTLCTYNITAGGPPAPPVCELIRVYPKSLIVNCDKGWDGGRTQMVHFDIFQDGVLIKNLSNQDGRFIVEHYKNTHNVTAVLYSKNDRGRSKERVIRLYSQAISEADNYVQPTWLIFVEAAVSSIFFLIFLVLCILSLKHRLVRPQTVDANPDLLRGSDEAISMIDMGRDRYRPQEFSTGNPTFYETSDFWAHPPQRVSR